MHVYTLTFVSDGETAVRVFQTEEGRTAALEREVVERYASAQEIGQTNPEDLGKLGDALDSPCQWICEITFGTVEVYLDTAALEG